MESRAILNTSWKNKPSYPTAKALEHISPGSLLDISAHTGRSALYFARLGWQVTALDTDEAALAELAATASAEQLPITTIAQDVLYYKPDQPFDAVLCMNVLHFLPEANIRIVITSIKHWVKPGGIAVLSAFTTANPAGTRPYLFPPDSLKAYFKDWRVSFYEEEYTGLVQPPGKTEPERYMVARLVAHKPALPPFDDETVVTVSRGGDYQSTCPFKTAMEDAIQLVKTVRAVTSSMQKDHFDPEACREVLDMFYSGTWGTLLSEEDSLYDLPYELDSLFVYVDQYKDRFDLSIQKQQLMNLASELWRLLPAFYRGHRSPPTQPPDYNPDDPYPTYLHPVMSKRQRTMRFRFDRSTLIPLGRGIAAPFIPFAEAADAFAHFVTAARQASEAMRAAHFAKKACKQALDTFYATAPYADRDENYYLRGYTKINAYGDAISRLGSWHGQYNLAADEARYDALCQELWLLLPDFYRGHPKPLAPSLSYNPHKPFAGYYPFDDLPHAVQNYASNPPAKGVQTIKVDMVSRYFAKIELGSQSIVVGSSYRPAYIDCFWFIECILRDNLPAAFEADEEGSEVIFYAQTTRDPQTVFVVFDGSSEGEEPERLIAGICNRRQMAEAFIDSFKALIQTPWIKANPVYEDEDLREINITELARLARQLDE